MTLTPVPSAAPVQPGDVLAGKYVVERVLGAGGMGVVVAARHTALDQHVAIKFLLPEALQNAEVVGRFAREARAAAKIHSEHVARVIDVGELPGGAPYMVMEYLEGTDLAHRIAAEGQLPLKETVRFLLEACEALAEAHVAGIVHRDIKPANLFLARRADRTSMVKVLDFGISKSPVGSGGGGVTSTQAVMGSPYYMSPEQLMSAKHVDPRSDIWSLGIVLYEALVGTPPYVGDTMAEIVAQILQAAAPSVHALRPDVPVEVDAVIARCLTKDVNARYRDTGELAAALAPFALDGGRSVDRISRVLGGPVHEAPPAPVVAARGATLAMQSAAVVSSPAQAAWGATQAGLPKKSHAGVIAAVGVAVLVVASTILLVTIKLRGKSDEVPATGLVTSAEATAPPVTASPPPAETATPASTVAQAASSPAPAASIAPSSTARPVVSRGTKPKAASAKATPSAVASAKPPPASTARAPAQGSQGASHSLQMGIK